MTGADEPSLASNEATRPAADADIEAVRAVLVQLDKVFRTMRTYGRQNHLTQRFLETLHGDLQGLVTRLGRLSFLVQRFELVYEGQVVYERPSRNENLAFKLYADGIRELSLAEVLARAELERLIDVLVGEYDHPRADEDVVTRLWEENLPGVSIVTADEIVRAPTGAQDFEFPEEAMGGRADAGLRVPASLAEVQREERAIVARMGPAAAPGLGGGRAMPGERGVGGTAAFDVLPEELEALQRELVHEETADGGAYFTEVMFAALGADEGPSLPAVADLVPMMFEVLIARGELARGRGLWFALRTSAPSATSAEEVTRVHDALASLGRCSWRVALETHLNASTTPAKLDGLPELLTELGPEAIPAFCELLGALIRGEHRLLVCDALTRVARQRPDLVMPALADPRAPVVRGLLVVLERLGDPALADAIRPLAHHELREVRIDALRCHHGLRDRGDGSVIVTFLLDTDAGVRQEALRYLTSGAYSVPASVWPEILEAPDLIERAESERRGMFLAVARSSGDGAVSYLRELVIRPAWVGSRAKSELGILAAAALGDIGTPAACAALENGRQRLHPGIRKACAQALERAYKGRGGERG